MNRTEMQRIAAAINKLRPGWRADSLETFIAKYHAGDPYRDVVIALTVIATDETTATPMLLEQPGSWWRAAQVALRQPDPDGVTPRDRCPYHPSQPKAPKCPQCADYMRTVISADRIRSIRQQAKEES